MILAAGYLLYMYGRVVFGELSDFLAGLGDHLTDMTPVEILTLAPLGALVVIFGLQPGLLLDLVSSTVTETLRAVEPSAPIAVPTTVVVGLLAILAVLVLARIAWVLAPAAARRPRARDRGRPLSWQDFVTISPLRGGHPDRGRDPHRRPDPAGTGGGRRGRHADRPDDHGASSPWSSAAARRRSPRSVAPTRSMT